MPNPTPNADDAMSEAKCRVVKRHDLGGHRIWDVYDDRIGDYVATLNPTLPVSSYAVAERIRDTLNSRRDAA